MTDLAHYQLQLLLSKTYANRCPGQSDALLLRNGHRLVAAYPQDSASTLYHVVHFAKLSPVLLEPGMT